MSRRWIARARDMLPRVAAALSCVCCGSEQRSPEPAAQSAAQAISISPELGMDAPAYVAGSYAQSSPAIDFDGSNYFLVWQDGRLKTEGSSSYQIFGAKLTKQGEVLDPGGILMTSNSAGFPSIAFGDGNHYMVWQELSTIFGARFDTNGAMVDAAPHQLSSGNSFGAHVAYDGAGTYLAAWRKNANVIEAATVAAATGVPSASFIISSLAIQGTNETPTVAWGPGNFLVAWVGPNNTIRGARVNSAGMVLDLPEITMASAPFYLQAPSLASDESQWFLAWQAFPNGGSNLEIEAVLLTPQAAPGNHFTASHSQSSEFRPQAAFTGSNYYLAWGDSRNFNTSGDDIYAVRVTTGGVGIDPSDLAVCNAPGPQGPNNTTPSMLSMACDELDGTCMAVWEDYRNQNSTPNVYGTPIDANGLPISVTGSLMTPVSNIERHAAAATDGSNFLVVWEDLRNGSVADIRGVLLDAAGMPVDPAGFVLTSAAGAQSSPSVAWNGSTYLVVWADSRNSASTGGDIYGARVNSNGQVLDPGGKVLDEALGNQGAPAVASNGTDFFVAWYDASSGSKHIQVARFDGSANILPPGVVTASSGTEQTVPSVASDGSGYLVVWEDYNPNIQPQNHIFGARFTNQIVKLDDPSPLSISAQADIGRAPRVTFGAGAYFVTWNGGPGGAVPTKIVAARVDPGTGVALDGAGTTIGDAKNQVEPPAVSWDERSFLVSWQVKQQSPSQYDVFAARVGPTGVLLDAAPVPISNDATDEVLPAAVGGGMGRSLIVYEHNAMAKPYGSKRVFGRFVSLGDALGVGCGNSASCNSLACVDGVCCDTLCGNGDPVDCQACDIAGKEGTCSAVPGCSGDAGTGGSSATGGGTGGGGNTSTTGTSAGGGGSSASGGGGGTSSGGVTSTSTSSGSTSSAGGGSGTSSGSGSGGDVPSSETSLFACAMSASSGDEISRWVLLVVSILVMRRRGSAHLRER